MTDLKHPRPSTVVPTGLRVYLAASSADMARAKLWRQRLRDAGADPLATWIDTIEADQSGMANPRTAAKVERARWSLKNLNEVAASDVVWLLAPPAGLQTRGGWFELGFAYCAAKPLVISGDTAQSVYPALGSEYDSDELGFNAVMSLAGGPLNRGIS